MGKLWQQIVQVRNGLAAFGLWVAVLILPLKIQQLPEALRWWGNIMPDRETLLIFFSGALVAWIFWIDLRPSVYRWRQNRNLGEASIRDIIRWIETNSAWWRWQIAQGGLGPNEWANYNIVAGQLYEQAQTGELTISARPKNKIERENISKDFWQLGTLEVQRRDDRNVLRVIVRPCNSLANDDEEKIKELGYVEPMAKWKEIKKLWPEKDRRMDRVTKKLLKQKNVSAAP